MLKIASVVAAFVAIAIGLALCNSDDIVMDRATRDVDRVLSRASDGLEPGTLDVRSIDRVCLVARHDPEGVLLGLMTEQELNQSFKACRRDLRACCSYNSETNLLIVVKWGRKLSCLDTYLQLKDWKQSPVCADANEVEKLLPALEMGKRTPPSARP